MTDAQNTPIITPVADPEAGTRIIFLRHGQTDWNIDHRFQGGTDIPLNDTGREQVRTAIGALKQAAAEGTTVDAIVSSPLSRAVESAEIVAEGLGVPYRGAVDGFQERSFGDLEGQIATRELILASRQSNNAFNVEPKKDFLARSLAALNRVRREYEGQTVVVAAHGMLIAMTMTALVAERHPELLNEDGIYPIPVNASLTEVPLQYLDTAIDRLVVQQLEPELGHEEVPAAAENTTLTLIRHGQTDWNKANLMQGITDIPLNDTGREQARTTGKKLADMGLEFTVLVSSRLQEMDLSLEEAAKDLGASRLTVFVRITLPIIAPARVAGWLLAFTLSLDDVVGASFVATPGSTTLPMKVFASVRMGISPKINALATLLVSAVSIAAVIGWYINARAEKRRQRDLQLARQENG